MSCDGSRPVFMELDTDSYSPPMSPLSPEPSDSEPTFASRPGVTASATTATAVQVGCLDISQCHNPLVDSEPRHIPKILGGISPDTTTFTRDLQRTFCGSKSCCHPIRFLAAGEGESRLPFKSTLPMWMVSAEWPPRRQFYRSSTYTPPLSFPR